MAQAFRGVGGQVIDIRKLMLLKQTLDERFVQDRAANEGRAFGDVVHKSAAQVVQDHDLMAKPKKVIGNVRTQKASTASNQ